MFPAYEKRTILKIIVWQTGNASKRLSQTTDYKLEQAFKKRHEKQQIKKKILNDS